MDYPTLKTLCQQHALPAPTAAQHAALTQYAALLYKWNKSINLIGRSTQKDIWQRHILDSLQVLPLIPQACPTLLDIGAGAGLPSVIIAIMRPDITLHACDINGKKISFINTVRRSLALPNLKTEYKNVEDLAATFPLITARAYATISQILQQTQHLSTQNTTYILPKGQSWQQELADADQIISAKNMTTHTISSITNPQGKLVVLS